MPLKVYYLDDELDILEIFSDEFANEDVSVTTFSDPKAAIDAIKANPPDLLFLDYRLPNTTGDQIALLLDPNIPKVLISGDPTIKLEAKFEARFGKPFSVKEMKTFIDSHIASVKAAA